MITPDQVERLTETVKQAKAAMLYTEDAEATADAYFDALLEQIREMQP